MYIINIKVNKDGSLTADDSPIVLSNEYEHKRVRLKFEIDPDIENTYHYIRFTHAQTSILFRVTTDYFDITRSITSYEGQWRFAFIVSDSVANPDGTFTGDYTFTSNPYDAVVTKGIEARDQYSGDQLMVKHLFECNFTTLITPDYIAEIGQYFLSQYPISYELTISSSVLKICQRAFYYSTISSVTFEENSSLVEIEDYAFSRVTGIGNITIPKSVTNYGHYIFENSGITELKFEAYSRISEVGSYSFWTMNQLQKLYFPDHLTKISGNTACIKACPLLEYVWIPNTITSNIAKQSFATGLDNLTTIELQSGFDISANFSNVTTLSHDALVNMLYALKNLTGLSSKSLTLGETNLAKLNESEKNIAINKNWTLA